MTVVSAMGSGRWGNGLFAPKKGAPPRGNCRPLLHIHGLALALALAFRMRVFTSVEAIRPGLKTEGASRAADLRQFLKQ